MLDAELSTPSENSGSAFIQPNVNDFAIPKESLAFVAENVLPASKGEAPFGFTKQVKPTATGSVETVAQAGVTQLNLIPGGDGVQNQVETTGQEFNLGGSVFSTGPGDNMETTEVLGGSSTPSQEWNDVIPATPNIPPVKSRRTMEALERDESITEDRAYVLGECKTDYAEINPFAAMFIQMHNGSENEEIQKLTEEQNARGFSSYDVCS